MIRNFLILIISVFVMAGCSHKEAGLLNSMGITVTDTTRTFSFTNKKYGQYYGQTNLGFTDGWQGWTLKEQRIFNDYALLVNDSIPERRTSSTTVFPYTLNREYKDGLKENFFFADSLDLIIISFDNIKGDSISFSIEGLNTDTQPELSGNIAGINIGKLIKNNYLYITATTDIQKVEKNGNRLNLHLKNASSLKIAISVAQNSSQIKNYLRNSNSFVEAKKNRIEKLLEESAVKTNDPEFDKAFLWAVASLDALVTEQDSKGIFAGLPWFNNNWGRDTFISLPGATLVTGNYRDAKDILLAFAKYQDTNIQSPNYGRIPNRVTLTESIYNTTDGTPWFVIQAYNYYKYSGDVEFLRNIYPAIKTAYDGAMKNYVDANGFLTHKDAETWMDAVGPQGPWSPRGNRANDIQALWYQQLKYSAKIAVIMADTAFAKQCETTKAKLLANFDKQFVDKTKSIVYDCIKKDGTPDKTIRPNMFFVLNEEDLIPSSTERLGILAKAMEELVFPYGVLSLSQNDENFHPYHQYPPYYVKDAAYHNGVIWLWNTGPVVQSLCNFGLQDKAWSLTSELTRQILSRGAVGALAELNDAFTQAGEKERRLSGTFSQAWSLAEYVRNFYQDYLGARPDAPSKTLYLMPSLPSKLKSAEFLQHVGADKLRIKYEFDNNTYKISVKPENLKDSLDIAVALVNKANASFQFRMAVLKDKDVEIQVPAYSTALKDLSVKRDDANIGVKAQVYVDPNSNQAIYNKVQFAVPKLNINLKALKGPDYKLLNNNTVKKVNKNATLLFDVTNPLNNEKYQYPLNPNFVAGILDISRFILKEDQENYYFVLKFKNLANPGWHNEYGFQLTYASICISGTDKKKNRNVGVNSGYILPAARAYNRVINVGGGFEIKDYNGKILAAYLPQAEDIKNPLGNTASKEISFAIPKEYLVKITNATKISILIGAQDDAGGAGIGTFRSVGLKASEWEGGGKKKHSGDNVYDYLLVN